MTPHKTVRKEYHKVPVCAPVSWRQKFGTSKFPAKLLSRKKLDYHSVIHSFILSSLVLHLFIRKFISNGFDDVNITSVQNIADLLFSVCVKQCIICLKGDNLFIAKPLCKIKNTYCQLEPQEQTSMNKTTKSFHTRKCISNCHLQNSCHFVEASIC